jgi:hypothetical protein
LTRSLSSSARSPAELPREKLNYEVYHTTRIEELEKSHSRYAYAVCRSSCVAIYKLFGCHREMRAMYNRWHDADFKRSYEKHGHVAPNPRTHFRGQLR